MYTSGAYAEHARRVLRDDADGVPRNTLLAYERKGAEFQEFCVQIHGDLTVTEEKVFSFLYYQCYRKTRRGTKRPTGKHFDKDDYMKVMGQVNDELNVKPVGYDVVNQYLCSILKIWKEQVDMSANNLSKDQIKASRVLKLLNTVRSRKKNGKETFCRKNIV